MSEVIEIPVELRSTQGKGASRRLRREGLVPGIIYGGDRDPQPIQIPHAFLLRALQNDSFYTSILRVSAGKKAQQVILRDLQRHPFKPEIVHIDFQRISESQPIRMSVPIHFLNEESSPAGKKAAVVISHQMTEIDVYCLPGDLPEAIELDLADIDVGDSVVVRDLPLPAGVKLMAEVAQDDVEMERAVVSAVEVRAAAPKPEAAEGEALGLAEGEAAPEAGAAEPGEGAAEEGED